MAVAVVNDWTGPTVGNPSGNATIAASADGLWMVYIAEQAATLTYTSITIGGEAPTEEIIALSSTTSVSAEQHIWSWYWGASAVAAMSASAIVLTKTGSASKSVWGYKTFDGASSATFNVGTVEASADNTAITIDGNSSINDWVGVMINRSAQSRDVQAYDTLTEGWQYNTDFTAAVADGKGGDDNIALTGDGFVGDWQVAAIHIKAGTGSPVVLLKALHEGMLNGE